MKKVCFTPCFKRKMSSVWESIIGIAGLVLIMAVLSGMVIGASWVVGYVISLFAPLKQGYIETGIGTLALLGVVSLIGWYIFKAARWLTKGVVGFIIDRYTGKKFECKIFQVCEEE